MRQISNAAHLISRNDLLLQAANLLELPYLTTTQYRKGLGEIVSPLSSTAKTSPLDKTTFSCIGDVAITKHLQQSVRNSVVISGIETHICVLQTALDLLAAGYQVTVVADAVGARSSLDHDLGLKRMETAGALPVTSEMLIYELLGRSDSEKFKKILPLIKG